MKTYCGTPAFLAPEVIELGRTGEGYTRAVDVWSLGCILYVMLSGKHPFPLDRNRGLTLNEAICAGSYELNDFLWKGVSSCTKDLVRKMMTVSVEERIEVDDACLHSWFSMKSGEGVKRKVSDCSFEHEQ